MKLDETCMAEQIFDEGDDDHRRLTQLHLMQGVIVAAPVYAATGSRWKALGISVASVSLFFIHPSFIVFQQSPRFRPDLASQAAGLTCTNKRQKVCHPRLVLPHLHGPLPL